MGIKYAKPFHHGCQCEHTEPCTEPVTHAGRFCEACYDGLVAEYWHAPHRIMFKAAKTLNWPMRPVDGELLPHPHEERKLTHEDRLQLNAETLLNQLDDDQTK